MRILNVAHPVVLSLTVVELNKRVKTMLLMAAILPGDLKKPRNGLPSPWFRHNADLDSKCPFFGRRKGVGT